MNPEQGRGGRLRLTQTKVKKTDRIILLYKPTPSKWGQKIEPDDKKSRKETPTYNNTFQKIFDRSFLEDL